MAQVPSTEDLHAGDGTTTIFQFTFPYLTVGEVFVSVDGVNVPYNMLVGSSSQVQTLTPPPSGSIVRVYRSTLAVVPRHLFTSGVPFLPRYVDENNRQLLYAAQEAINDTAVTAAEALVIAEEAKDIAQEASDKVDAAIIESAAQLRDDLESGVFSPGWTRNPLRSAVSTVNQMLDTQYVNIWEFADLVTVRPDADDPGTWNWTPAFVAAMALAGPAFDSGPAPEEPRIPVLFPAGMYLLDPDAVVVGHKMDLAFSGAVIRPFDPLAVGDYLIRFTSYSRILNLTLDAQYSMSINTMLYVRGRHNNFIGVSVWRAAQAWRWGDEAWATNPAQGLLGDSENIMTACETIWCVTAGKAYGLNTILHFNDCLLYSYKWTLPVGDPRKAAWEALPETAVYSWGAVLYFNGGAAANFSGQQPLFKAMLQPVSGDPAYKNSYGRFICTGQHHETGWLYSDAAPGAYAVEDQDTSTLRVSHCGGYVATSAAPFILQNYGLQEVFVDNTNEYYGNAPPAIIYSATGRCHVGPRSFRKVTGDVFQNIRLRYPVGYESFCSLDVHQSTQVTSATLTALKCTTFNASDVYSAFDTTWYNTGTGVYQSQVAQRNFTAKVGLAITGAGATEGTTVALMVNGIQRDAVVATGVFVNVTLSTRRIPQFANVEIRIANAYNRTLDGSANNYIVLTGAV